MNLAEIIYVSLWLGLIVLQIIRWHVQLIRQQEETYLRLWEEESAQTGAQLDAAIKANDSKGVDAAMGRYRVIAQSYVSWLKSRR